MNSRSKRKALMLATTVVTTIPGAAVALAQDARSVDDQVSSTAAQSAKPGPASGDDSDTLQEIIVTAQKRAESVQSVPLAITVVPAETLQRQGVQTITDLSRLSSALEFTTSVASPGGGAFIRGVGTAANNQTKSATGSVSIVVDGVSLGNANISDIFDLNRVEVLKGPQGTLFGSSVSAGVINITTNAPDLTEASAKIIAEYGARFLGSEYRRGSFKAAANLPINDVSALRVSVHNDENAGVFDNTNQNISSSERSQGIRARLLYKPSDDLSVNLIADYNRGETDDVPYYTYRDAPPGSALANSLAACGVTPSDSNFDTCSEYRNFTRQTDWGGSAQIDWKIFGDLTLTSISAYRESNSASRFDIEAIPLSITQTEFANCGSVDRTCTPILRILNGGTDSVQTQDRTQYSQELRLASPSGNRLEWLAGIYYQHYKLDDNSPGTITLVGAGDVDAGFSAKVHSEEYAAFGNLTFHLDDATQVIAGARYTHSKISEGRIDPYGTGNGNTYSLSTSASAFTWRASAQHNFTPHTMAYITVSTGYKGPLISDNLQNGNQMFAVKPEHPINYEIGIKQSLLNNRLAFNADIFYEKVKNYQGQSCVPTSAGINQCLPSNVPSITSKGVEVDIFGRPVKGLSVNMSASYTPTKFPNGVQGSDGSDLSGKQLYYSSKMKVTLSAEQRIPLTDSYSLVVGGDYTYRSKQRQFTSGLPQYVAPATNVYNARLGISSSADWGLYIFGRNLGDEHVTRQIASSAFQSGATTQSFDAGSKRIVGLQLEAGF